jgi:hypothetical protein
MPDPPDSPRPKEKLLRLLESPEPEPMSVLYFFCRASVARGGNEPILRFARSTETDDELNRDDLGQSNLEGTPFVFANACTTTASDTYMANELESIFFDQGCRAFLGTETEVPIQFASRFAAAFFHFFYRKVDGTPMAAGEALAQARLFFWTHYKNLGGLLYSYVNQYDLYLASEDEIPGRCR